MSFYRVGDPDYNYSAALAAATRASEARAAIKAGDLVTYDSIYSGLVPGKVLSVSDEGWVRMRVTAGRGSYMRGEVIDTKLDSVDPR